MTKETGQCHLEWIYDEIRVGLCWAQSLNLFGGIKGILITVNRFNGFVQFAGLRLLPNPLERTRFYDFLLEHH